MKSYHDINVFVVDQDSFLRELAVSYQIILNILKHLSLIYLLRSIKLADWLIQNSQLQKIID